ncbi:MAG: hypothetical protein EOM23_04530, partial [Candidatus Moranbacteria bacterium]|nr:hypothetical protein [Candidatus Moranbacteria bacterium]
MKNKMPLIAPEIKEILSLPNKEEQIQDIFLDFHPRDIFLLCEDLDPHDNAQIVMALGQPLGIEFFQEFKVQYQRAIFAHFSKAWMGRVLDEMAPDERV